MVASELKFIIRNYYKQLYINKFDNLEKMNKFLETYNLPQLNTEEIESLNRPITHKEIESIIKNLTTKKNTSPEEIKVNSTKF